MYVVFGKLADAPTWEDHVAQQLGIDSHLSFNNHFKMIWKDYPQKLTTIWKMAQKLFSQKWYGCFVEWPSSV